MSPCDRCGPLLTALGDGELGRVTAWRVQRHLAHCPRCSTLYAEIQQVGAAAHALRAATTAVAKPPADLNTRVLRRLAESPSLPVESTEALTSPVFSPEEVSMPAPIVAATHRPFTALLFPPALRPLAAAAAVTIVAIGLGAHILVPGKPRVAFADVRRAVQQVRTAHIHIRVTAQNEAVQVLDAWLRTEPAGFAMLMPEKVRMVGDEKGIVLYPGENNGAPIHVSDEKITKPVITDLLISPNGLLGDKPGQPDSVPANWGEPEMVTGPDGSSLLRFQTEKDGTRCILWADPESRRPVRVEAITATAGDPAQKEAPTRVEVDFAYNETPPPGTF